jgi:hypothetical protein
MRTRESAVRHWRRHSPRDIFERGEAVTTPPPALFPHVTQHDGDRRGDHLP